VAEGARLESVYRGNSIQGSNPCLSATSCYDLGMKATLEIDDDLLERAEQIARERGETTGKVVSDLLRKSIDPAQPVMKNGFEIFPDRDASAPYPDLHTLNLWRDDD
jgi:hypothetical protein